MIILFTIRAEGGRQGSRTLIPRGETALAGRPGKPYPATFQDEWTAGESNPDPAFRQGIDTLKSTCGQSSITLFFNLVQVPISH